jgi:hypothetical protein
MGCSLAPAPVGRRRTCCSKAEEPSRGRSPLDSHSASTRMATTHNYDKDAEAVWNANFDEGLEIAKATNAKEA